MKKIIFLLSVSLFSLVSCSKDDEVATAASMDGLVLLHQTITTFDDPASIPEIENYTYSGNHIVSIGDNLGFERKDYTYVGELISKVDHYFMGALDHTDYFQYNSNNLLSSYISHTPQPLPLTGIGAKEVYVYNTDGTISFTHYSGDMVAQTTQEYTGKIFFSNDEISKIQTYTGSSTTENIYAYDAKKNTMKNVTGYRKISFYTHAAEGVVHNITSDIENTTGPSSTTTTLTNFTYNTAFYPLTSTQTEDGVNQDGLTQYIY